MALQCITHHGFRYCAEAEDKEKLEAEAQNLRDWLYLILVVGLTVFFFISFFIL